MTHTPDKPRPRDKKINFIFRCQPRLRTKHGMLLQYLNDEEESILTRKERVLQALAAYWLPFAYRRLGTGSRERMQEVAREAVYHLLMHVRYIEEAFGLDARSPSAPRPSDALDALLGDSDDDDHLDTHGDEDDIVATWH